MEARKTVYKITYPNGKIYIGKDLTDSANCGITGVNGHVALTERTGRIAERESH